MFIALQYKVLNCYQNNYYIRMAEFEIQIQSY